MTLADILAPVLRSRHDCKMARGAEQVIDLYDRYAKIWDKDRARNLFEKAWLDRFMALLPAGGSVLDIGCGSAEPIGRYFIEAGYDVCGVYGPKGNDTGGIIPWSPVAESVALDTAQRHCGYYYKHAVITTVHRRYGDYITYDCRR